MAFGSGLDSGARAILSAVTYDAPEGEESLAKASVPGRRASVDPSGHLQTSQPFPRSLGEQLRCRTT